MTRVRWQPLVVVALAVAAIAWALHINFLSDDAFISFRYARNLARGDGLVFNLGERVEGYTNFLEVVVLAGLHRVGVDLVEAGRFVSLVGSSGAVVLSWMIARRYVVGSAALVAPILVASSPFVAVWAGSGLESTIFASLGLAMVLPVAGLEPTRQRFLAASILGLLLGLTRPEGVAWYAVLTGWCLFSGSGAVRMRFGALVPGLAVFSVGGASYFAWRWWYFGDVLPNTFYAKAGLSAVVIGDGFRYLRDFARNDGVLVALPLVVVGGVELARRAQFFPLAILTLIVTIVVLAGGDGLPMYRFLVPAIPWIAILAAVGCSILATWWRPFGLTVVVLVVGAAIGLSLSPRTTDRQHELFVYQRDVEIPNWIDVGKTLGRLFPGVTIAAVPIGAVAFYSDLRTIDMLGLTDRTIAHTPVTSQKYRWAGHERHNGPYVLSRRPEILLIGNIFVSRIHENPPGPFPPYLNPAILAREEDLARAPEFSENYDLTVLPLTGGRYLHFCLRKDIAKVVDKRPDKDPGVQ